MMVQEFNREILGIEMRPVGLQKFDEHLLSYTQLMEEANEMSDAHANKDIIGVIDAVIDSMYFAYGILYKLGLDEDIVNELFCIVHTANMHKKKGLVLGRPGFNSADAAKPEGWKPPEELMMEALADYVNKYLG